MESDGPRPAPLALKPDLEEADRRWKAFYEGDLIDRPVVCVTAPADDAAEPSRGTGYRSRVFGDIDAIIDREIANARRTWYGGEAVPSLWLSFGPDEVAVFCGAELRWCDGSGDTNWSEPFVDDRGPVLPLRLHENHPLWQRIIEMYRRAVARTAGTLLLTHIDLHTNMDLLAAIRGPQRLCMDLIDQPEMVDRAMADARAIFPKVWNAVAQAGRMDELGYCHGIYSMEGAAFLQCDFSCMISPEMFRRWVMPALEEEVATVKHSVYHWDGPDAVKHIDDLCSLGFHALSYVPGAGRGGHYQHLDLLKRVQQKGKAVQVWGSVEEVKAMHRELQPDKVFFCTSTSSRAEGEALLEWFVKNT